MRVCVCVLFFLFLAFLVFRWVRLSCEVKLSKHVVLIKVFIGGGGGKGHQIHRERCVCMCKTEAAAKSKKEKQLK